MKNKPNYTRSSNERNCDMVNKMNRFPRVMVFGSTGYIGQVLMAFLRYEIKKYHPSFQIRGVTHNDCDITNREQVMDLIHTWQPTHVFNLAAKADTEWCEKHFIEALHVNMLGAMTLRDVCAALGVHFTHFSSGCIYKDDGVYHKEEDKIVARCQYAQTKRLTDMIMEPHKNEFLTIRMRQPFSAYWHPRNILAKLATYEALIQEDNSMSCLEDCLPRVLWLALTGKTGIWNLTNGGSITPYRVGVLLYAHNRRKFLPKSIEYRDLLAQMSCVRVNTLVSCDKFEKESFGVFAPMDCVEDAVIRSINCAKSVVDYSIEDYPQNPSWEALRRAIIGDVSANDK